MEKHTYNYGNVECDWCEQIKDCRGLYDPMRDEVVLTICEDCDMKGSVADSGGTTEFDSTITNTNTKENNVMSNNTSILCEEKNCQSTGRYHMLVWALNYNAYALESLPYQDDTWQKVEMDFCGTHKNVLHRGNAVQLKLAVNPVVSYDLNVAEQRELFNTEVLGQNNNPKEEVTMSTNYSSMTIEELEELAADLFQEGAEIYENRSAYETEQEWQELLDDTSADLKAVEEAINSKKEATMPTTKKILCGHCKEYHNTPAEVAECYGVTRKSTSNKQLVQETEGYIRTWFASKKDAVQYLKGLPSIKKGMNPAKNGHGFWTYQAKG